MNQATKFILKFSLYLLLLSPGALAQDYVISTIAGGVPPATPAPALKIPIGGVQGLAADSSGNVYFNALNCIFKMDAAGNVTRIAGNGRAGLAGDGGLATQSELWIPQAYASDDLDFNVPSGITVDSLDNIYFADSGNLRIRKISMGLITTVAGGGLCQQACDGQPATNLKLYDPGGVAADRSGNLYISDGGYMIYRVDPMGILTTVANTGFGGAAGLTVDPAGNLYVAEMFNNYVLKVAPDGTQTIVAGIGAPAGASILSGPAGLTLDSAGNLYITDAAWVRKLSPDGTLTSLAGTGYTGYSGDGGPALQAQLSAWSVALDGRGNILITDQSNRIRAVSANGTITTVVGTGEYDYSGDGVPATEATLAGPNAMTMDTAGNLYFADGGTRIRMISPNGIIRTVAGTGVSGGSGDGGPAIAAQFRNIAGLAADADGNLYVADPFTSSVRRISPDGIINTLAGPPDVTDPTALALDKSGNLYIADGSMVRKVSGGGVVSIIAGNGKPGTEQDGPALQTPLEILNSIAVDDAGNVYVGSFGAIYRISAAGIISTVPGTAGGSYIDDAGLPYVRNAIDTPAALTFDISGNLYVSGGYSGQMYRISADGTISEIAGTGLFTPTWFGALWGYSGDGGPATQAQFVPGGLVADGKGDIYVADVANNAIRYLQPLGPASIRAVHNAASNLSSPVAPGEMVIIGGSGLGPQPLTLAPVGSTLATQLAGTTVTFDGVPAPIVYTSSTQVAAIVPFEVKGTVTQVAVSYLDQNASPLPIAIAQQSPAIFTADSSGTGQASALNFDGTLNNPANPAAEGYSIAVLVTGEGVGYPAVDGQAIEIFTGPVSVTIGNMPAQFSNAFGRSPGVFEVTAIVPGGLSGSVPVTVKIGNAVTQAGVTIAVK